MPELVVINPTNGSTKTLASNVSALHRWYADSTNVLLFQIKSKDKQKNYYGGQLIKLNVSTGKSTPIAEVLGKEDVFFRQPTDGVNGVVQCFWFPTIRYAHMWYDQYDGASIQRFRDPLLSI